MKNNKELGEIGERIAIGELAKFNINVLIPLSDNLPYDFVIDYNGKLYKCQVKTTSKLNRQGSLEFSLTTNNWYKGTKKKYSDIEFDIWILCDLYTIYLFKFKDLEGKGIQTIRVSSPKNNQVNRVVMGKDVQISKERLGYLFK